MSKLMAVLAATAVLAVAGCGGADNPAESPKPKPKASAAVEPAGECDSKRECMGEFGGLPQVDLAAGETAGKIGSLRIEFVGAEYVADSAGAWREDYSKKEREHLTQVRVTVELTNPGGTAVPFGSADEFTQPFQQWDLFQGPDLYPTDSASAYMGKEAEIVATDVPLQLAPGSQVTYYDTSVVDERRAVEDMTFQVSLDGVDVLEFTGVTPE